MKNLLKKIISIILKIIINDKIAEIFISNIMSQQIQVVHNNIKMTFSTPNRLSKWRALTFSKKEPETLAWIDNFNQNTILWDIGANVGLYSIYAAKKNNISVWAFEPSVFNLELLSRNIYLNKLVDQISIFSLPLNDIIFSSKMQLTTSDWGGALSTFDKQFGWDGKKIKNIFEYKTIGIDIDTLISVFKIPMPTYIKIDVDGLEHFILRGGKNVLNSVKEVLIEINDDFDEQSSQCIEILHSAGLILKEKKHSEMIANNTYGFENSYNQIWVRK